MDAGTRLMPLLPSEHNLKDSRILVLKVKDGLAPKSSTGLIDRRLFTNENNLRAVMDTATSLWHFKYDSGIVEPKLRGRWTSFSKLLEYAKNYFDKRNVEIVNVID